MAPGEALGRLESPAEAEVAPGEDTEGGGVLGVEPDPLSEQWRRPDSEVEAAIAGPEAIPDDRGRDRHKSGRRTDETAAIARNGDVPDAVMPTGAQA